MIMGLSVLISPSLRASSAAGGEVSSGTPIPGVMPLLGAGATITPGTPALPLGLPPANEVGISGLVAPAVLGLAAFRRQPIDPAAGAAEH